jgi:hypothetical protein
VRTSTSTTATTTFGANTAVTSAFGDFVIGESQDPDDHDGRLFAEPVGVRPVSNFHRHDKRQAARRARSLSWTVPQRSARENAELRHCDVRNVFAHDRLSLDHLRCTAATPRSRQHLRRSDTNGQQGGDNHDD